MVGNRWLYEELIRHDRVVNPHLNSKSRGKVSLKATSEMQDVVKGHELEVHNSIHEQEDFKLTSRAVAKKADKLSREKWG